jgi:cobyrinic acid a,c-diamide synthase
MEITRETVAGKLAGYLRHEVTLDELVDWAESAMQEGQFAERGFAAIRDAVARIGLADVRAFGLTWEDCEQMLQRLGYQARVSVMVA